jgi:epoxyqueuosine reductase
MVEAFQTPLDAATIKDKARALGADLVGIAAGAVIDENPPDPNDPRTPSGITDYDGGRVIVMAKRYTAGTTRIAKWDERHKYYNDEITLTMLEETSLELVYWLEDHGYPAIIIPPTHVDPWRYDNDPDKHLSTLLSLSHAAVEAGLGTLGLNLQLLTPQFGPRVIVTAVMCSVECDTDKPLQTALCKGPECGRCLSACPGDVVGHWDRDWPGCDRYRSPHGFAQLSDHLGNILGAENDEQRLEMLRSEESFNLWQSILRGAGVITGCRRCQDVCPVGEDYAAMLKDALDDIPEATPEKTARLAEMIARETAGDHSESRLEQDRWIGKTE